MSVTETGLNPDNAVIHMKVSYANECTYQGCTREVYKHKGKTAEGGICKPHYDQEYLLREYRRLKR